LNHAAAARATLEATTRLRRAVYHHAHRLGPLAVRPSGPGEAVGMLTRHVEAIQDTLFTYLTVVAPQPVKFALLLLVLLVTPFGLASAFTLGGLVVWLVGGQIAAYSRRQARVATRRGAMQLALLQESLRMMRLAKVYLMELFNQSRVERQLAEYARMH